MAINISLRKSNFTVDDGYFFTFDEEQDALLQKTDDGNTAFSYPCDTLLTNTVKSLEYDGVNYWSLETSGVNLLVKRWRISNYLIKLQETFTIASSGADTYSADCFTVEHYHTNLTSSVDPGETILYIDDYSNKPEIIAGVTLHIGPNINGEEEDIPILETIFGGVILSSPVSYSYSAGVHINFHKYIWLFNNNDGTDTTTGALYKFNSHTGAFIKKFSGGAYKAITACTYYKIQAFEDIGPTDMLLFAKGTNTLFVNTSDYKRTIFDADTMNDSFSSLDVSKWTTISGSPSISSSKLYLDPGALTGHEAIQSTYYLPADFDVYISGNLLSYENSYTGSAFMENYIKIVFHNEQDRFCKIARGYSCEFGGGLHQNFSVSYRKGTDVVFSTVSGTEDDILTNIDIYGLRIKRVAEDIHFYYRTTTDAAFTAWRYLGVIQMFSSDATLVVGSYNTTDTSIINTFDDLIFDSGTIVKITSAVELPYFGSMVMDNISSNVPIALQDMAVDRDNLYRLQGSSTFDYFLSPLESFVTSISLSASPAIIAANGLSTTDINAWVKDQFLQPVKNRRVTFSEAGDGAITGGVELNTDSNGFVQTVYRAGVLGQDVLITATVQQTN